MKRETSEGTPKTLSGKRDAGTFMGSIFVVSLLLITSLSSLLVIVPNNSADILKQYTETTDDVSEQSYDPENGFATASGVSGDQYVYGEEMFGPQGIYRLAYSINGSSATLVGWYDFTGYSEPSGKVVIPSTVSDGSTTYNINSIGDLAFQICYNISTVMIPSSITSIGSGAFDKCHRLTYIEVDSGNLGYVSVDGVLYNKSMTELMVYPAYKTGPTFSIPSSVTSIADYAFSSSNDLISIAIPSGVTHIGINAFNGSQLLTSVTIPSSVKNIGSGAFSYCRNLVSIDVDSGNPGYISVDGVLYNRSMTELMVYPAYKTGPTFSIPSSVTSIADYAFFYNTTLKMITMPSGLSHIGTNAFFYCMGLSSLNIPESVTYIGTAAFAGCLNLSSIQVDGNNPAYTAEDGILYDKSMTELLTYPILKKDLSFTIPSTVTTIMDFAFFDCKNLTSLTMPDSVTHLGRSAFSSCSSLKSLTISSGLTEISENAFSNCQQLTSVSIPSSVTYISDYAFENCLRLESLTIPSNLTHIGKNAFRYCDVLNSIDLPNGVTYIGNGAFNGCRVITSVSIPESVTYIGSGAFSQMLGLTSIDVDTGNQNYMSVDGVLYNKDQTEILEYPAGKTESSFTVPSTVVTICESAFYACTNLTSITLPQNLTFIGNWAFLYCQNLVSPMIPSDVKFIGYGAFLGCSAFSSMIIPENVEYIGAGAFSYCNNLPAINVESSNQNYMSDDGILYNKDQTELLAYPKGKAGSSFTVPSTVVTICESAFNACNNLTSITLQDGVRYIDDGAFSACMGLTTLDLPSSLISIGSNAFTDCSGLTFFNIPEGVVRIGTYPFQNCENLSSITIPSSMTSLGSGLSLRCKNLTSISVDSGNQYYVVEDGALYNISKTQLLGYPAARAETSFNIPSSVIRIEDYAFHVCKSLTSVTIPSSVVYIRYDAFYNSAKEVFFEAEQLPYMETNVFNADAYYSNGVHDAAWWRAAGFTYEQSKTGVYYDVDLKPLDGDTFTGATERFKSALGSNDVTISQSWVDGLQSGLRYTVDDGFTWNPKSDLVGAMTSNAIGYGVLGNALRYDVQGGEGVYLQGGTGTVTLYDGSDFAKKGYKLEGWTTEPDGAGTFHALSEQGFDLSADTTLYAKWTPIQYRIEFNGNGSTGGSTNGIEMTYDASGVLSDNGFVKDGHIFKGWALTPDGPAVYQSGDSILNMTDVDGKVITLYAVWEFTGTYPSEPDGGNDLIIIAAAAVVAVLGLLALFFLYRKKKDNDEEVAEDSAGAEDKEDPEFQEEN